MMPAHSFSLKRSREESSEQATPVPPSGERAGVRQEVGAIARRATFLSDSLNSLNLRPETYNGSPPRQRQRLGVQPFTPQFAPFFDENGCPKKPARYMPLDTLKKKPLFLQSAVRIQQESQFFWRGRCVSIAIQTTDKDKGQFNIFARIANGPEKLFPEFNIRNPETNGQEDLLKEFNIKNSKIAIKTFRDHCIMVQSGKDKLQQDAHENVLNQYEQSLKAGIPVARIYNVEEAEAGCGFFIVEYVPHSFEELLWPRGATLNSLSEKQMNLLTQLRNICTRGYRADIILDLKPENLRIREHGTLAVIDLRENVVKAKYKDSTYETMIRTFHCAPGDEIYNFLMTSLTQPDTKSEGPVISSESVS